MRSLWQESLQRFLLSRQLGGEERKDIVLLSDYFNERIDTVLMFKKQLLQQDGAKPS